MSNVFSSQSKDNLKIAFLPIKPVYAERLMDGTKLFEFRRRPMSPEVTHIVVYASSPRKRILGIVAVTSVERGSVNSVWSKTKQCAGITRQEYLDYFTGVDIAYAIAIDPAKTVRFDNQLKPSDIEDDFVVPQSFKYVGPTFMDALLQKV